MKSSQYSERKCGKFVSMKSPYPPLLIIGLAMIVVILASGCHALQRGDFIKTADDVVIFKSIGFRVIDNAGLSRDCITTVKSSESDIQITVPYAADMVAGLTLSFDTVSKDARVGTWVGPNDGDIVEWTSGTQLLTFADALATQSVRIVKTDPETGETKYQDYAIRIRKILRPKLMNPDNLALGSPVPLRFAIVDEDENPIPMADALAGTFDPITYPPAYDSYRFDIDPATFPVTYQAEVLVPPYFPEGFEIFVNPKFPNEHKVFLPAGIFKDALGYETIGKDIHPWESWTTGTKITFSYDPPAMHLAYWGNDTNPGTPDEPVRTWTEAVNKAQLAGIFDIYIAASQNETTDVYDVAGEGQFDGTGINPYFNVYGGWRPDFSGRYQESGLEVDSYPPTILFDSTQSSGTTAPFAPSSVLIYDNPAPFPLVLDDVNLVVAPQPTPPALDVSTALWLRNGTDLTMNRVQCQAYQGDDLEPMAFAMTTGAVANVRESFFVGRDGGTSDATALYLDSSNLNMESSFVISGDQSATGQSVGIFANFSMLNIDLSWIIAGFSNPNSDPNTEDMVFGILALGTTTNFNRLWIHTGRAVTNSVAFWNRTTAGGQPNHIVNSAFFAGRADSSVGIVLEDFGSNPEIHLFNSVIHADTSNMALGTSAGLRIENLINSQIMGNTIRANNQGPGFTYGIEVTSTAPPVVDIRNNLVYSTTVSDLVGIQAPDPIDITNYVIRNNDFWDTNTQVELKLAPGPALPLSAWHSSNAPNIYGNINEPVSVDMGYNYSTEDFNVGRIQGTPPTDVMMGGEDLSGAGANIAEYPEDAGTGDKMDREWNRRTGFSGLGWTMGPYEIDSGNLPSVIYVAQPTQGGDDGNPLGTADHPFATPNRAYDAARRAAPIAYQTRWDVQEIRVLSGVYNIPTLVVDNGSGLYIRGGYGGGTSTLTSPDSPVIRFENHSPDPERFEYFTVESSSVAAISETIRVANDGNPVIRNNTIKPTLGSSSYTVYYDTNAKGTLTNNTINGGNGNTSYGLIIENNSFPMVTNNTIDGGSPSNGAFGVYVDSSAPFLEFNTIYGGDAGSTATGISVNDGAGMTVLDNDIDAGNATNTLGIQVIGDSITVQGNTIYGGGASVGLGTSTGIDLNAFGTKVTSNTIEGGTGLTSRGAYITTSADLRGNTIDGGSGSSVSVGVEMNGAHLSLIDGNDIVGGHGNTSIGLSAMNAGVKNIVNNRIFGGEALNDSYGIRLTTANQTTLINNLIHGGVETSNAIFGVYINNGGAIVTLLNNTIYAGRTLGPTSTGVEFFNGAQPVIENNIVIAGNASPPNSARAVNQIGGVIPSSFLNNFILSIQDQAVPYRANAIDCMDSAAIDDSGLVDGGPGPPVDLTYVNVLDNAAIYFNRFTANGGESQFFSDDWHLRSGTPGNPRSYGTDLSASFAGYGLSPATDYSGTLRSVPWSVGAYEF